jgi:hypothetical protein
MGPDAEPTKAADKLSWLKKSQQTPGDAESVTKSTDEPPAVEPAPAAARKKRGPKKPKRKPGEV